MLQGQSKETCQDKRMIPTKRLNTCLTIIMIFKIHVTDFQPAVYLIIITNSCLIIIYLM